MRQNLAGLSLAEIGAVFSGRNPPLPAYRAAQVHRWILNGAGSFDQMTNLPAHLRAELSADYSLRDTRLEAVLENEEETIKLRLVTEDGNALEAVILNDGKGRHTACVSSQAGCPMGCVFCKTGSLGFSRNLSVAEIIEQLYYINDFLVKREKPPVENIVFMGMGEPMLNLDALQKVCAILFTSENSGKNRGVPLFSKKRITLSTCGLAAYIRRFAEEGPDVRLAVSLTSGKEDLRRRLMPGSSSLSELKEALVFYQEKRRRRITLEVVLLSGLNTSREDAAAVAEFASGLDVIVNIIPWNPVKGLFFEGAPLASPGKNQVVRFCDSLRTYGVKTVLRLRKGSSISGACGQLGEIRKVAL
ncbi:MAG: 23S rRNA (adenine(2503)-C(2))-methyltransferase RlmN [Spirochaetaceae bacterium]|jgi:23S rRNA (adenine2503-C2)-methyltransferase|nr:23S rRNA (adenine(2503)-C(2))-methyltransferase RlmN [Spirochaetaceae bacterium]